jgi:hypothetical protein
MNGKIKKKGKKKTILKLKSLKPGIATKLLK